LAARVRLSLSYIEPALDAADVRLRLHDTTLYNSIYRYDDEMLVNAHAYGVGAAHSPVMHLRRTLSGRLFEQYMASFERVWECARTADRDAASDAVVA
jgi:hypothetical protein